MWHCLEMTKPLYISQGVHDLLLSGRITGMNKNPLNVPCIFDTLLQAGPKPSTILTSRDSKRFNVLAPLLLKKSILDFILALGDSLCQSFLLFFFHKCCRLNFVPNNPDSVPSHFLDEPLSSIMTNYGA